MLLGILIGVVVGWNLPQPTFAKVIQQKVLDYIHKFI